MKSVRYSGEDAMAFSPSPSKFPQLAPEGTGVASTQTSVDDPLCEVLVDEVPLAVDAGAEIEADNGDDGAEGAMENSQGDVKPEEPAGALVLLDSEKRDGGDRVWKVEAPTGLEVPEDVE